MADVCYYDDKEYSEGAVISVDGDEYMCTDSGTELVWEFYVPPKHPPGPNSAQSAEAVEREEKATVCYYDGKKYSPGAVKTMGDGNKYQCGGDGKWRPAPSRPSH